MRHAWILAALVAGLTAIACSGGEDAATTQVAETPIAPPISAGQPKTIQFDQALSEEVSQLRTEVASLQDEEATAKSEVKEPPPTQRPTEPTATGQPDAKASDQTQMGICYRTPELQKKILELLNVRLCQVVSAGELFRIRKLESVNTPSVKEGDFQGFANVESMTLRTGKVEANGLRGLDGLKEIHLVIQRGQALSTESFMGIESVEELRIELSPTEAGGGSHIPELPELPNLKHLTVQWMNAEESDPNPFRNLKDLETLNLRIAFGEEDAEAPTESYLIPADLLKGNENLKEVRINTRVTPSGHEVQLPEEIFRENPALERAEITYPRTFIERHTFSHLDNLKELLLLNSSSSDPVKFPELVISKKSPLYQSIRSGETRPSRYLLAEAADD